MKPDEVKKILEAIVTTFGPFLGALLIFTVLVICVILYFFKKRIESIADEISKKAVTEFGKKLDLAFRDEALRIDLQSHLGKTSIDKKLTLYEEVYSLYFDYQKSWTFKKETPQEDIRALWSKILQMRQKIFLNSIYLGGYLTDNLLKAVISMHTLLEDKVANINNPLIKYFPSYVHSDKTLFSEEERLGEYLDKSRTWLYENLLTDQNIRMYDFTDNQKNFLREEREKIFHPSHEYGA